MLFTVNAYPPAFPGDVLNDFMVNAPFANGGGGKTAFSGNAGASWTAGGAVLDLAKKGIMYGNGVFVSFGGDSPNGHIERSVDGGVNWTTELSGQNVCKVGAYSPSLNRFFVGGTKDTGNWYSDDNGDTWTPVDNATSVISVSDSNGCCWSPELGIFVTVPGSTNNVIEVLNVATSTDGIVWDLHGVGTGANFHWGAVDWSPQVGRFVATAASNNGGGGTTNVTYYSTDGENWVQGGNLPSNGYWFCVKWNPILQVFLALKNGSSQGAVSSNGASWSAITMSRSSTWYSLACNDGGIFCAVDATATCSISSDATNWTDVVIPNTTGATYVTKGRLP
jgi:hypothetical protein